MNIVLLNIVISFNMLNIVLLNIIIKYVCNARNFEGLLIFHNFTVTI